MAIVHVKQFVKASSGTSIWMSAVLEPPQHRDVVEMALCEVAGFGILVDAPRYDHDTDTFFIADLQGNIFENRLGAETFGNFIQGKHGRGPFHRAVPAPLKTLSLKRKKRGNAQKKRPAVCGSPLLQFVSS